MIFLSSVIKRDLILVEEDFDVEKQIAASLGYQGHPSGKSINYTLSRNAYEASEKIIAESEKMSEAVIAQAHEHAKVIFEKAAERGKEAGYIDGFEKGIKEGQVEVVEMEKVGVNELNELCQRVEEQYIDGVQTANNESLDFAFELAEKIIGIEINRNDAAFISLFESAAAHIGEASTATLKVGPRGYEIATHNIEALKKSINGLKHLEIEADGEDNGKCLIETDSGDIDASTQVQLEKARKLTETI
jgi:flagellar biosynthesis/type III secretory pathway protein FliH